MRKIIARSLAAILAVSLAGTALAQQPKQAPQSTPDQFRKFDYWQPDWMVRELWGPGNMPKGMMIRLLRHNIFLQYGLPKEYEGAKSAITADAAAIDKGRTLYKAECATCHGADGMGSGDPGKAVSPSPALLAYMIKRPIAVDEYLLWSIGDGGVQFNSEMPAFKDKLARDDIWRIIAYMRAGFPEK